MKQKQDYSQIGTAIREAEDLLSNLALKWPYALQSTEIQFDCFSLMKRLGKELSCVAQFVEERAMQQLGVPISPFYLQPRKSDA